MSLEATLGMIQGISAADLAYWGTIRQSVAGRASTSDVWNAIRATQERFGLPSPSGGLFGVTRMRSIAAQQRNAVEAFAAAGPEQALSAAWVAPDINSRPITEQEITPIYNIRMQVNVATPEGEQTAWLTYVARNGLPATKGDILDLITTQSQSLGIGSNLIVTGTTGLVEMVAV